MINIDEIDGYFKSKNVTPYFCDFLRFYINSTTDETKIAKQTRASNCFIDKFTTSKVTPTQLKNFVKIVTKEGDLSTRNITEQVINNSCTSTFVTLAQIKQVITPLFVGFSLSKTRECILLFTTPTVKPSQLKHFAQCMFSNLNQGKRFYMQSLLDTVFVATNPLPQVRNFAVCALGSKVVGFFTYCMIQHKNKRLVWEENFHSYLITNIAKLKTNYDATLVKNSDRFSMVYRPNAATGISMNIGAVPVADKPTELINKPNVVDEDPAAIDGDSGTTDGDSGITDYKNDTKMEMTPEEIKKDKTKKNLLIIGAVILLLAGTFFTLVKTKIIKLK